MSDLEFILDAIAENGKAYFTSGGRRYMYCGGAKRLEAIDEVQHRAYARHGGKISEVGRRFVSEQDAVQYACTVGLYERFLRLAVSATQATGVFIDDDETRRMFRTMFESVQRCLAMDHVALLRSIPGVQIEYLSMSPEQVCAGVAEKADRAQA